MGLFDPIVEGAESFVGGLTGKPQAQAATEAAQIQLEGTKLGIEQIKAGQEQAFGALAPFQEAGAGQLAGLSSLISDPQAQLSFIQDNPFFESMAQGAQSRLFANQAARGKVGTGGTAAALQNELLSIGNQLIGQNINQRMGLVNVGLGAAGGVATTAQAASGSIADLIGQGAGAQAAGVVGAANAQTNALNQLIQAGVTGGTLYALSDRRAKKEIKKIGKLDSGLPVYQFKYKGGNNLEMGVMAQDVEKVIPSAVIEIDGVKHVDYSQVA